MTVAVRLYRGPRAEDARAIVNVMRSSHQLRVDPHASCAGAPPPRGMHMAEVVLAHAGVRMLPASQA